MPTYTGVPSHQQVEMLLQILEKKRWLVLGHARTSYDRERTKAAWEEIANKLNNFENGCSKTWQQWSKYWKDKKAGVKRKAILMKKEAHLKRNNNKLKGEEHLSKMEVKIIDVLGGDDFLNGDKKPVIEVSQFDEGSSQGMPRMRNDPLAYSTPHRRSVRHRLIEGSPPHSSSSSSSSSHERWSASLNERFVAIEEKRVENERLIIDNQQKMWETLKTLTESWSRQTQALQDFCRSIVERNNNNNN